MTALLLSADDSALRGRALREWFRAGEADAELVALGDDLDQSAAVRAAEAAAVVAGDPAALGFALCRLAFVGLGPDTPSVRAVAERLFAMQQRDGSWPLPSGRTRPSGRDSGYSMIPLQTALPLRGLAAAGFGTDPRAERAYEWLSGKRLDDGSWPTGRASGVRGVAAKPGSPGPKAAGARPGTELRESEQQTGFVAGYRRLPGSPGCRSNTTAALACLAFHTERRLSDEARTALDLILRRETRDEWALGYEVARLVGAEPVRGFFTFYARYDLAFVLELASRCGASREDGRVADLACFIEDRRGEFGLWEHPAHPRLSRWLTLELLLSLRRLETGDWSGSDLRMPFRPYAPRRDRH